MPSEPLDEDEATLPFPDRVSDLRGGARLFERYLLTRKLGEGGMGIVWLARDETLRTDIALKFLPSVLAADPGMIEDLKAEVLRGQRLAHDNIVRTIDFVADSRIAAISMEFVDGQTFCELRRGQPGKILEAENLHDPLAQLCAALDYAHNKANTVHRDLKPRNLMRSARGILKLADFGISSPVRDSMTRSAARPRRTGGGTLVYMSPQQNFGEPGTPLDDVYSLGATFYELLTSRPPFYSGNIDRQIAEKIPPALEARRQELGVGGQPIPRIWQETIAACLAKEPGDRPQSAAEVIAAIDGASTRRRATTPVPPPPAPHPRFELKAVIVIALLLIGLFATFFAFRNSRQDAAAERALAAAREEYERAKEDARKTREQATATSTEIERLTQEIRRLGVASTPGDSAENKLRLERELRDAKEREARAQEEIEKKNRELAAAQAKADAQIQRPLPPLPTPAPPPSDIQRVANFLAMHLQVENELDARGQRDFAALMSHYAEQVDYMAEGVRSQRWIAGDKADYFKLWPLGKEEVVGLINVRRLSTDPDVWQAEFESHFHRVNPATRKLKEGTVQNTYRVRRAGGTFQIVQQKIAKVRILQER